MRLISALAAAVVALGISAGANAAEIALLSPNPIKETMDRLVANYETKTGNHVQVTYGTGVGTRDTVAKGGAKDVTLLFAPFDDAIRTGNVDRSTATVVARLRLAIAVKKARRSRTFPPLQQSATRCAVRNPLLLGSGTGQCWWRRPAGAEQNVPNE